MDTINLSKSLYNGYRLSMTACVSVPTLVKGYKQNEYSVNGSPVIFITYKPPKGFDIDRKTAFFKLTPKNLYRTILFFNRAVDWFYDKELADLYLVGENNELIFNSDYSKLSIITNKEPRTNQAMKAIPGVISYEDGRDYEGIFLYINKPEYVIPLPLTELEAIFGILRNFSFEALTSEMLLSYFLAGSMNRIEEADSSYKSYSSSNIDQWK